MGWNRPSGKKVEKRGGQWNVHLRGLVAGVIVVVGAAVAAWWIWPKGERAGETPPPRNGGLIKEVTPAKAPKAEEKRGEAPHPRKPQKPANWKEMTKAEKGAWMRENWPREKVSTGETIVDFRRKEGDPPQLFTNTLHMELNGYLVPGRDMPPPEYLSDEAARKAFETIIEISPEDSEEARIRKEGVIDMLGEMAEWMRQGGHANDYLQKIYARQEREAEAVETVRRNVRELIDAGDCEGAAAALKKFNEYLEGKGIAPVYMRGVSK